MSTGVHKSNLLLGEACGCSFHGGAPTQLLVLLLLLPLLPLRQTERMLRQTCDAFGWFSSGQLFCVNVKLPHRVRVDSIAQRHQGNDTTDSCCSHVCTHLRLITQIVGVPSKAAPCTGCRGPCRTAARPPWANACPTRRCRPLAWRAAIAAAGPQRCQLPAAWAAFVVARAAAAEALLAAAGPLPPPLLPASAAHRKGHCDRSESQVMPEGPPCLMVDIAHCTCP